MQIKVDLNLFRDCHLSNGPKECKPKLEIRETWS